MARRKKAKKTSHKRRSRRIGALALSANSPLVNFGSIAAGYLIGDKVDDALANVTGSLDPKIKAAALAVAGFIVRKKVKGTAGKALGGIMMGAAAKMGLKEFGIISGVPVISGYRDVKALSGVPESVEPFMSRTQFNSPSVLNGIDGYQD